MKTSEWNKLILGGEYKPRKYKPKGYWTYDRCKGEAKKYKTKREFEMGSSGAYGASLKKGWLDELFPSSKWTYERCKEEALKYKTRSEFAKGSRGAYEKAIIKGWLDDICGYMKPQRNKPNGYWTYDNCKKEALKYKTKREFEMGSSSAYQKAIIKGWLDDICSHMDNGRFIWTYDNCKKEALKYKTRSEFAKGTVGAYNKSWKNKWLDKFFPK